MESEKDLLKGVEQSRSYIQEQMEVLSRSKVEKEQISKEVDAMSEGELSRQDKVKRMDLNVKIHKLDEKAHAAEVGIDMRQRKIKEMEKKIAELRKKSFLQRFLRQ
jgi:ABC-type iron transport system FetAB ATPase subunit